MNQRKPIIKNSRLQITITFCSRSVIRVSVVLPYSTVLRRPCTFNYFNVFKFTNEMNCLMIMIIAIIIMLIKMFMHEVGYCDD